MKNSLLDRESNPFIQMVIFIRCCSFRRRMKGAYHADSRDHAHPASGPSARTGRSAQAVHGAVVPVAVPDRGRGNHVRPAADIGELVQGWDRAVRRVLVAVLSDVPVREAGGEAAGKGPGGRRAKGLGQVAGTGAGAGALLAIVKCFPTIEQIYESFRFLISVTVYQNG